MNSILVPPHGPEKVNYSLRIPVTTNLMKKADFHGIRKEASSHLPNPGQPHKSWSSHRLLYLLGWLWVLPSQFVTVMSVLSDVVRPSEMSNMMAHP